MRRDMVPVLPKGSVRKTVSIRSRPESETDRDAAPLPGLQPFGAPSLLQGAPVPISLQRTVFGRRVAAPSPADNNLIASDTCLRRAAVSPDRTTHRPGIPG